MQYRYKKIDYTTPAGASGGPGVSGMIGWYAGTPFINMTSAVFTGVSQAIGATLGDVWWLGGQAPAAGGNAFAFAKATAGLTVGQIVSLALPTTGTATVPGAGTAASPLTTTASVTTNINNAATGTVNGEVDNYIYVNATGATLGQLRRIKASSVSTTSFYKVALQDFMRPNSPTDADVFDTLATNADPLCIIRPWNVVVNTATTMPVGVSLGTVTSGNFTVIQVAGLAIVSSTGTGTATVANQPGSGGAAGVVTGVTPPAAWQGSAVILPLIANAGTTVMIPAYVNFLGQ